MAGSVGTFMETFSPAQPQQPPTSELDALEIISIVRLVLGIVGAAVWSGALEGIGLAIENVWTKESIKVVVQGGLRLTGSVLGASGNQE